MADVKTALYQYFAQKHFNDMPPAVWARFQDYIATNDFQGNMRHWPKEFMAGGANKKVPDFTTSFNTDDWETLYDWFQETLQKMYDGHQKGKFAHDDTVRNFIMEWFGPGKIFRNSEATNETETALTELEKFLSANASKLRSLFQSNLQYVFDKDLSYDKFCDKLHKKDYNSDLNFRDKVNRVIDYIASHGPNSAMVPDQTVWPANVGYSVTASGAITLYSPFNKEFNTQDPTSWVNKDPQTRFKIKNKSLLLQQFEWSYKGLLNKLLGSKSIRDEFAKNDSTEISTQLKDALEFTSYDDEKSKSYVSPKQKDEKTWLDRVKKWKDDKYEDYLKKFFEPGYGSRIYYSPYAQTIAKALDKLSIKPTDGIKGIIAKKDDILKEIEKTKSGNAKSHFEWFVKTMETVSKSIPGAYESALKNPHQMRDVVSQIIIEAIKADPQKIKQAKTAMEILSVAKYGMLTSKTMNAVNEGLKDVKLFSDDKLSWNKNEGIQTVTKAIDATAKLGIRALGTMGTGIYNFMRKRSNKFGNNISSNKDLNDAYKAWKIEDANNLANAQTAAQAELGVLTAGNGVSGRIITSTTVATLRAAAATNPKLKQDIDRFDKLQGLIDPVTANTEWRKDNSDQYHELIAYWDMLESFTKTHSFKLGSINVQRKAFLKDYGQFKKANPNTTGSKAEQDAFMWNLNFGDIRTA